MTENLGIDNVWQILLVHQFNDDSLIQIVAIVVLSTD